MCIEHVTYLSYVLTPFPFIIPKYIYTNAGKYILWLTCALHVFGFNESILENIWSIQKMRQGCSHKKKIQVLFCHNIFIKGCLSQKLVFKKLILTKISKRISFYQKP